MKRITLVFTVLFFTFSAFVACVKNDEECTQKTVQSEDGEMQSYATNNGIIATRHSSGMYYQINTAGDPTKIPTLSSTVRATYTGKLMNGTTFDSGTATFPLSGVIAGWQLGLPLIGKGGKIKLIIPSSLAYGCTGRSSIPPYAILFFDVELVDVL